MSTVDDLFEFVLPDGTKSMMTIVRARGLGCRHINARCDEIIADFKEQAKKKRHKDGFVPGWQENIRMYITCPAQYKRALRDLGLVEVGYDITFKDNTTTSNPFASEEMIRAALQSGIELSGREIDALQSGEYFKDVKLDLE